MTHQAPEYDPENDESALDAVLSAGSRMPSPGDTARLGLSSMQVLPPEEYLIELEGPKASPNIPRAMDSSSNDRSIPVEPITTPLIQIRERYMLGEVIRERQGVTRFRGVDNDLSCEVSLPITVLRQRLAEVPPTDPDLMLIEQAPPDVFDTMRLPTHPTGFEAWPSIGWESSVLTRVNQVALPRIIDRFCEDGFEYLIEESPVGQSLWDAWADPQRTVQDRFGWLIQIAETLRELIRNDVILEELRPEMFIVSLGGQQVVFAQLHDLLPLPLTPNVLLRISPYTPPEMAFTPSLVDARAMLYSFGAMLYALLLGRELTDLDSTPQAGSQPFLERYPDAHPLLGRLLGKTYIRDVKRRFPANATSLEDPTGFTELLNLLNVCQRQLGRVRFEIGCWTTTGMHRGDNEDALAVLHSTEAKLDDIDEFAMVLLADGMGGMDSGEIAASMAMQILRAELLTQPPFAALASGATNGLRLATTHSRLMEATTRGDLNAWRMLQRSALRDPEHRELEPTKERILMALKEANRQINHAARHGLGPRGMGCTAEVIYLDGANAVIGHVGDSRTYHLTHGRFTQITRDHTLVNRLIELGHLTVEEAEYHPRRAELQQALGGRPEVDPELYVVPLKVGDWLVCCSDGLTNQIRPDQIPAVLLRAGSAERAARLLINIANLDGANDNVSVVVVRITGP